MSISQEAERPMRLTVLSASAAVLAVKACNSLSFVQLAGPAATSERASQPVASLRGGVAKPKVSTSSAGTSPALGAGLLGAAVLAAHVTRGRARTDCLTKPLRAFEGELGVQPPFGFWDPAGLTKDGDMESFKRRRATELKHGRVSMLACMGYITPEYFKFPGYCSPTKGVAFADIPNGLAALSKVPAAGWLQIFAFIGTVEKTLLVSDPARAPGDFENAGVLGVPNGKVTSKGEGRTRKLNAELANGRLAMMAIIGMFYQDGLTGSAWGDWSLYTESPLRAFESELGVQAPVGYWDPAGYASDGDVEVFRRRREVELKHGRVSMFACMGYITPEYYRFPGFLSPSERLEFKDVPNGLAALSKVPFLGWAQILVFVGLVDFGFYRQDPSRAPGDYENGGILGVPNASGPMSDAEGRKRKLNAELANGRLAMVAIMGMMFQNGYLGTTGPEMWFP